MGSREKLFTDAKTNKCLELGIDIDNCISENDFYPGDLETILLIGVKNNCLETVQFVVEKKNANISYMSYQAERHAFSEGKHEIAEYLKNKRLEQGGEL